MARVDGDWRGREEQRWQRRAGIVSVYEGGKGEEVWEELLVVDRDDRRGQAWTDTCLTETGRG